MHGAFNYSEYYFSIYGIWGIYNNRYGIMAYTTMSSMSYNTNTTTNNSVCTFQYEMQMKTRHGFGCCCRSIGCRHRRRRQCFYMSRMIYDLFDVAWKMLALISNQFFKLWNFIIIACTHTHTQSKFRYCGVRVQQDIVQASLLISTHCEIGIECAMMVVFCCASTVMSNIIQSSTMNTEKR